MTFMEMMKPKAGFFFEHTFSKTKFEEANQEPSKCFSFEI